MRKGKGKLTYGQQRRLIEQLKRQARDTVNRPVKFSVVQPRVEKVAAEYEVYADVFGRGRLAMAQFQNQIILVQLKKQISNYLVENGLVKFATERTCRGTILFRAELTVVVPEEVDQL